VLVSRAIPMADYVEQTGCGQIVESVNSQEVLAALAQLESDYDTRQIAALQAGQEFSQQRSIVAYKQLYVSLLALQGK